MFRVLASTRPKTRATLLQNMYLEAANDLVFRQVRMHQGLDSRKPEEQ